MKNISRTVWLLSGISLLTDAASEMLYPVMPMYLRGIGFSVVLIGVLEGVAEAIAGVSKGYFGSWSDLSGRRAPFVQVGYALSSISKPMMGLFALPLWILFARTIDRLGKGIRTGARDAMLSDESTPENKGTVFGFHRSMDTLGAVIGPTAALWYLHAHPGAYRPLFFIAFAPALCATLISLLLKDTRVAPPGDAPAALSFSAFLRYWREAPAAYRTLVRGLLVFAVINSSDVFLLLRAREIGLSDVQTIGAYIFYNIIFAVFAWPIGILADRVGLKWIYVAGLGAFFVAYLGMAFVGRIQTLVALFFVYGLFAAATDGIAKAWIAQIAKPQHTATAIGTFAGFQSVCALLASSLAGVLWSTAGPTVTFALSGVTALGVAAYLAVATTVPQSPRQRE